MEKQHIPPKLTLTVDQQDLSFYTTLLQAGIEIKSNEGETMAHLLSRLPGFTVDYISDSIQTIFLNGTAIDDLSTPFKGKKPVLALSAAMPGLAGAIFRRNSFHAALRTSLNGLEVNKTNIKPISITLKLFNSIAIDRGPELFEKGVCITTRHFMEFLTKRTILQERIGQIYLSNLAIKMADLATLLGQNKKINLTINSEKSD